MDAYGVLILVVGAVALGCFVRGIYELTGAFRWWWHRRRGNRELTARVYRLEEFISLPHELTDDQIGNYLERAGK